MHVGAALQLCRRYRRVSCDGTPWAAGAAACARGTVYKQRALGSRLTACTSAPATAHDVSSRHYKVLLTDNLGGHSTLQLHGARSWALAD